MPRLKKTCLYHSGAREDAPLWDKRGWSFHGLDMSNIFYWKRCRNHSKRLYFQFLLAGDIDKTTTGLDAARQRRDVGWGANVYIDEATWYRIVQSDESHIQLSDWSGVPGIASGQYQQATFL